MSLKGVLTLPTQDAHAKLDKVAMELFRVVYRILH